MTKTRLFLLAIMAASLAITGCLKKSQDQASAVSGFETLSATEELAQLPQANITTNQQTSIETLPIETSPVTQSVTSTQMIAEQAIDQATSAVTQTANRNQQIQTALKNAGFYAGSIDGKIGPASKRAIEAFQKSNNLKVDGKVGPKTWAALEQYLNAPAASTATTVSN